MIYFYEYGEAFKEIFTLDVWTSGSKTITYNWTDRPIESGSPMTPHGVKMPTAYSVSGILSAHRIGEDEDRDSAIERIELLEAMADDKTIFTVVDDWRTVPKATIKSIKIDDLTDGDAIAVTIEFQPYTETEPETVDIPRSRLKNPRKGKGTKKGKEQKKDATPKLPSLFPDGSTGSSWASKLSGLAG